MAATTVNGGDEYNANPHNPHLAAMRQAAERTAHAGETLVKAAVGQAAAAPTAPQRRTTMQSSPAPADDFIVEDYEPAPPIVSVPEPKTVVERIQGYLQQQVFVAAVLVVAGCLLKKAPALWDHRTVIVAILLLVIALVLGAREAGRQQEVDERLYAAACMGDRLYFFKHLQSRESRYLLLLEVAIGCLCADVFMSIWVK